MKTLYKIFENKSIIALIFIFAFGQSVLNSQDLNYKWIENKVIKESGQYSIQLHNSKLYKNIIYKINNYPAFDQFDISILKLDSKTINTYKIENPNKYYLFDFVMIDTSTILISSDLGIVFKSTDGGKSWTHKKVIENSDVITAIGFRDNDFGLLANNGKELYYTNDGGDNWSILPNQIKNFPQNNIISKINFYNDTILVEFFNYIVFSFDLGKTWNEITKIDNFNQECGLYYKNKKLYVTSVAGKALQVPDSTSILYSNDFGNTWVTQLKWRKSDSTKKYISIGLRNIAFLDDMKIGLACDYQLCLTLDGGTNWIPLLDGLPISSNIKNGIFNINNKLYVLFTDNSGNYFNEFAYLGSIDEISTSKNFNFKYNNNILEVEYSDNLSNTSMTLYDINGRKIFSSDIKSGTNMFDLSNVLSQGVAFGVINENNKYYFFKFMK